MVGTLERRSERLVAFVHRRAGLLLCLVVALVSGLLVTARDVKLDNGLRIWFEDGDPVISDWDAFKRQFGNDEFILIGATDPVSVYSPAALTRIRAAAERLEQHPKIRRVTSIATGLHVDGDPLEIRIEPLLADGPVTERAAAAVRERVEANPVFQRTIATDNERITLMIVEMATVADIDAERPEIVADVRQIAVSELERDGGTVHISGMGVVYEGLNAASLRDSARFMTLSYLVVFIGLWVLCRRAVWVAAGACLVTLAVALTIGMAGAAGRDLNMVTAILPTLLMSVGILDLVHILDAYEEGRAGRAPSRGILIRSVAVVLVPCAFNSLTDMLGFAALAAAPMNAVRDFGWLAAAGLGGLFAILLLVTVYTLGRFGGPGQRTGGEGQTRSGALLRVTGWLFELIRRRQRLVLAGAALVVAITAVGISRVKIDTYTIGFLDRDDPVRIDHDRIERDFGLFVPYDFAVRSPHRDGVKQPQFLRAVDEVERAFEADSRISRATGLPEILARVNQVVMDGDESQRVLPSTPGAVAQELLLYETDRRNELDKLVDPEMQVARVTARGGMPSVAAVRDTIKDLETRAKEIVGPSAEVEGVGYMAVYVHVLDNIARTQIVTFAIALMLITIAMMVFLRSIRLGLIALIPNLLPVGMTVAFMGFAGINLDVATVLIASIVIGISVNDTTHILFRFRQEIAETPQDRTDALRRTMHGTGRAVIASSVILALGFSVLLFAEVKSISHFGLLCGLATIFALIADLVITPALLLAWGGGSDRESLGRRGHAQFPHDDFWLEAESDVGVVQE